MKKVFFFTCMFICLHIARADDVKVTSKIERVTLFLNNAQITRTAAATIPSGTSILVFENISPGIDVQSIQVKASGDFTILSVKHELNFLNEQITQKKVEELRLQQKSLKDKLALQNGLLAINQEEYNMLVKNQVVSGQNTNLDVLKLKQALDFQTIRLTENKKKEQLLNNQIIDLNSELQKYDKQIADISKGNSKATSNILVTVSAKTIAQSQFTLTYLINNASWFPTYDIRAKNINSPISIIYKANVSQQSGEDWKNVKLTLSTGNPTVSGSKPELSPYYLNHGMVYAGQASSITKVTGRVYDRNDGSSIPGASIRVKGTSIGTQTDAAGNYSIQVPAGNPVLVYSYLGYEIIERSANSSVINVPLKAAANQLNEVVTVGYSSSELQGRLAGVQVNSDVVRIRGASSVASIPIEVKQTENQTNIEFNIANPYTVPSDGKQYLVEVKEVSTNADYQYYVAPKLSTDVFLTARITDWNKYNFLSGEANLFFEGTFIGKSLINTNATADTLNLSLGTDKNIIVNRTLKKDINEKQGLLGSNKKETRDWLITVKNRKNQPVKLLVEDQVPVSQNADINVDAEVADAQYDKLTGKVSWGITLNPLDEKLLSFKYQVKYPKNQIVLVQ
jgi:hypothetical protein